MTTCVSHSQPVWLIPLTSHTDLGEGAVTTPVLLIRKLGLGKLKALGGCLSSMAWLPGNQPSLSPGGRLQG